MQYLNNLAKMIDMVSIVITSYIALVSLGATQGSISCLLFFSIFVKASLKHPLLNCCRWQYIIFLLFFIAHKGKSLSDELSSNVKANLNMPSATENVI